MKKGENEKGIFPIDLFSLIYELHLTAGQVCRYPSATGELRDGSFHAIQNK